jgi:hypothetical protein
MTPRATHPNGWLHTISEHVHLVFPTLSCSTRMSILNGQRMNENRLFCLPPVHIDNVKRIIELIVVMI